MRSTVARLLAAVAGALCALCSLSAHATFHTYVINEIYSNADGTVQFVELREALGESGQNFFAGIRLVSSSGTSQQTFTFPGNLPTLVPEPAYRAWLLSL